MHYIIYKTTNLINGKFYIGKHQTKDINDGYIGSGKLLRYALKKYGTDNFRTEVLLECPTEAHMNLAEKILVVIDREVSYNLCPGGHGGFGYINKSSIPKFKGKKHTEESKLKVSKSREQYTISEETKQKISENNKRTNASRGAKTSANLKGRPKSEEHKQKIRLSSLKRRGVGI